MREAEPSKTAQRVAIRRAVHQLIDAPTVFTDPLALRILGSKRADWLRANPHSENRSRFTRYLRAFVVARQRVAEDALAAGVERGVTQYVILGAGLDTFAYRNPYAACRVFEVDAPATQSLKKELLAATGIPIPASLTFVPVDFEQQSLADELARAGLDTNAKTVFAWLGVTMYLTPDVVAGTVRYIASVTTNGGGVVFDYASKPKWFSLTQHLAARVMRAKVAAAGEPFKSAFKLGEIAAICREAGFTTVEDIDGAALNDRYFAGRTDGLRVGSLGHVMTAFR